MKGVVDALRSAGVTILDSGFILSVVGGLDSDYESIVAVIMSQIHTLTLPKVRHLLISQEIRNNRNNLANTAVHSANAIVEKDKERPICVRYVERKATLPWPAIISIMSSFTLLRATARLVRRQSQRGIDLSHRPMRYGFQILAQLTM